VKGLGLQKTTQRKNSYNLILSCGLSVAPALIEPDCFIKFFIIKIKLLFLKVLSNYKTVPVRTDAGNVVS